MDVRCEMLAALKIRWTFGVSLRVVYDGDEVTYENDVLTLTLPKTTEAQPHQISPKVNGALKLKSAN
jgi:HSP20 family molecular chaperone IbpA